MVQQKINFDQSFDPIAFELKHEADFLKAEAQEHFNNTYADGSWDGHLLNEPQAYQWQTPEYRRGYLEGIAYKFDEMFAA